MATKKKTRKKSTASKTTARGRATSPQKRTQKRIPRKSSKKKTAKKSAQSKKVLKKTASVKKASPSSTKTRKRPSSAAPPALSRETWESRSGGQSGDLQGLSNVESADSESVDELIEEGNAFEAGVVSGVEEGGKRGPRAVRTREV